MHHMLPHSTVRLTALLLLVSCTPVPTPAPRTAPEPTPRLDGSGDTTTVAIAGDSLVMRILPPLSITTLPDDPPAQLSTPAPLPTPWLPPSTRRLANGAPGPDYWQQRADYAITAILDTADRRLRGHVTLRYTNRSPDTLHVLWLHLDQNLFRADSRGARTFATGTRWRGASPDTGGYALGTVTVDGVAARTVESDTRLRVELPRPLVPRSGTLSLDVDFAFRIPEHGADRMGRDGSLFYLAQWYPRVAVYDDVRGWNAEPYLGQGEFYLEYGDIDYTITVPAGFIVGGSGLLQNADELLTPVQRARLAQARRDTGTTAIITEAEARSARTALRDGVRRWRFRAQNVRDVAWAAAPDFRWDSGHWGEVQLHALYQPDKAGRTWEHAVAYTRWSLASYSALLDAPYPYPQATSVATTANGMEYPMFVVNDYGDDMPTTIFDVNDHEHGHAWFPMIVGSNERRYAWMDEGINSYLNLFTLERFHPERDSWGEYVADWQATAGTRGDVPLMTPPDAIPEEALGTIAYLKPAIALMILRNAVVGPTLFDEAMRSYVRRWRFKHPTPWDFFRTIEDVTGESLGGYWQQFFHETGTIDVGIDSVTMTNDSSAAVVHLTRHGRARVPVSMRLVAAPPAEGATGAWRDWTVPLEAWAPAGASLAAVVPLRGLGPPAGVVLWPDGFMPDHDPSNDSWGAQTRRVPRAPVTEGGRASAIPRPPRPVVRPDPKR
jgi:hypothetical protein